MVADTQEFIYQLSCCLERYGLEPKPICVQVQLYRVVLVASLLTEFPPTHVSRGGGFTLYSVLRTKYKVLPNYSGWATCAQEGFPN